MLNIDILGVSQVVTNGGTPNGASPISAQTAQNGQNVAAQSDTPSPVGGSAGQNGQMAAMAEPLTAAAMFAATGLHPAAYPAASKTKNGPNRRLVFVI